MKREKKPWRTFSCVHGQQTKDVNETWGKIKEKNQPLGRVGGRYIGNSNKKRKFTCWGGRNTGLFRMAQERRFTEENECW